MLIALHAGASGAHSIQSGSGYLEVNRVAGDNYRVLWTIPNTDGPGFEVELAFDQRCTPLSTPSSLQTSARIIRTWTIRCPGGLAGTRLVARGLAALPIDILVRFADGSGDSFARLTAAVPWLTFPAAETATTVARTYVLLGIEHILLGVDHLLFVFALVLLVRGWRRLVATITAFTAAHSVTLAAAVLGFVHVPQPPVEATIALSIALVAGEIVHRRQGRPGLAERKPWVVAFAFGLLHGLGFAGALSEIGLPPHSILLALLFFNVGVELGQLAFIATVLPVLALVRRLPLPWPAWSWRVAPYVIGSLAMYWATERITSFWR
jgi:hydrogenase/urease accessory protein HupE